MPPKLYICPLFRKGILNRPSQVALGSVTWGNLALSMFTPLRHRRSDKSEFQTSLEEKKRFKKVTYFSSFNGSNVFAVFVIDIIFTKTPT